MEKTTIVEKLVGNAPLLVLMLGVASFVPGATGGIYTSQLQLPVTDPIGRSALMTLGVVLVVAGGFLLWADRREKITEIPRHDFKLQITQPLNHARVGTALQVRGTFDIEPPDGMARVLELVPNTNMYHAKSRITIDKNNKTWLADIKFGGGGKTGDRRVFMVVLAGKSADLLFEYYRVVGRETGRWVGIPGLPPDVVKCSQVEVEIQ